MSKSRRTSRGGRGLGTASAEVGRHPNGRRPLVRAEQLLAKGRAAEAASLMVRMYLRGHDPQTAAPDEDRIDAVGWYVQAVKARPDAVPSALAWARWAYAAAQQLHADGSADPEVLQVGVDTLVSALLWAGHPEEAFATRRESIKVAAGRRDSAGAQQRHMYLACDLHTFGHCAEAAEEALVAFDPVFDVDRDATNEEIAAVVSFMMALESCHRHDAATALAARLGRHPAGLAVVALMAFDSGAADLLNTLTPAFQAHTAQHHGGERCGRADCPLARDGAVGARFYAALLSSHDPERAQPDIGLIRLAIRFALFPDADEQTVADAAAWAMYCHRATLALPTAGTEEITTATRVALIVADRRGNVHAAIDACRATAAALTGRADMVEVVAARMELAHRLHRAGFCEDALVEAAAALTAYDGVRSDRDVAGVSYSLTVAGMFDACHRHTEARSNLSRPFDGTHFNDDVRAQATWLEALEASRIAMLEHARAFHADATCVEEHCAETLAGAADIPHRRALRTIMSLYEQHRITEAADAIRRHLAELDPETSPPSHPLADVAVCHLVNAVEHAPADRDASVLPWGRYARRAADVLDPGRGSGWAELTAMFARAASAYGAHAEAIDAAREIWVHHHGRGDILAALGARLDLASALHDAGQCADAREHATEAWTGLLENLNPADPDQQLTRLLAGTDLVYLLGDCHLHDQASALLGQVIQEYNGGSEPGFEARERRWQRENRRFIWRSHRHRTTFHRDDPCLDQHEHHDVDPGFAAATVPTHTDIAAITHSVGS